MKRTNAPRMGPVFLGIECGGTHTVAILADHGKRLLQRVEAGPANARLMNDLQLRDHLLALAAEFPRPEAVAIGMAGIREEADRSRVRAVMGHVWPKVPCHVANDLETGLAAAEEGQAKATVTRVLVISGTGSCCFGRNARGATAKVGGWGHMLGDAGSGYDLGLSALRAVVGLYDQQGEWPALGIRFLRALALNEPNQLIDWALHASKPELAALAVEVFAAWAQRDPVATRVVLAAADVLATGAAACAGRLSRKGTRTEFYFTGGVLLKQPAFARLVTRRLRRLWPGAVTRLLPREGVWGAASLAMAAHAGQGGSAAPIRMTGSGHHDKSQELAGAAMHLDLPASTGPSPTEQRNPRSTKLDRMTAGEIIDLMLSEDAKIPGAVLVERAQIAKAVHLVARAIRCGGRLFYVGAGTSGRLGVLDASECPPTFQTPPEVVQGIMAGGQTALWSSIEGAEDHAQAGADAIRFRGVRRGDVMVGIAASGRTPFVWGALGAARRLGAATVLICFNPYLGMPKGARPNVVICPNVGPEVLTGSTRLKAGTATKLILNILTTASMVLLGKVIGNLMVDLNPSNTKLRDRAVRIVCELGRVDYPEAEAALKAEDWRVKRALRRLSRDSARRHRQALKQRHGLGGGG